MQSFAEWRSCEQPANAMVVKARATLLNSSLYRNGGASSLRARHSMNRGIVPRANSLTGLDHAGLASDPGKKVLVQARGSARSVETRKEANAIRPQPGDFSRRSELSSMLSPPGSCPSQKLSTARTHSGKLNIRALGQNVKLASASASNGASSSFCVMTLGSSGHSIAIVGSLYETARSASGACMSVHL